MFGFCILHSYALLRGTFFVIITVSRSKGSTFFVTSSCMLLDEKTVLEIWLNPGLNFTMFRETGPRSENGCKKIWHFFIWNRVKIWRTGRHTPTKNSQEKPLGGHSCLVHFINITNYASLFTMDMRNYL